MELYEKFKELKYWFSKEKNFYGYECSFNTEKDIEKYHYYSEQYNKLLEIEKQALIEFLENHPHILDNIKRDIKK